MTAEDVGREIALTINSLDIDQKDELIKAMVINLDKDSKFILENELGVVI